MPATSSRISASSSTMRISSADSAPFLLMPVTRWSWSRACVAREGQTDERTALTRCTRFIGRRRVLKRDAAVMVFHDLLDDRKAKARAFGALRHVGLSQAIAVFRRQANAVVDHFDCDRLRELAHVDLDAAAFAHRIALAAFDAEHALHRFASVLQHVRHRLADE